jgi:hypothetical protein
MDGRIETKKRKAEEEEIPFWFKLADQTVVRANMSDFLETSPFLKGLLEGNSEKDREEGPIPTSIPNGKVFEETLELIRFKEYKGNKSFSDALQLTVLLQLDSAWFSTFARTAMSAVFETSDDVQRTDVLKTLNRTIDPENNFCLGNISQDIQEFLIPLNRLEGKVDPALLEETAFLIDDDSIVRWVSRQVDDSGIDKIFNKVWAPEESKEIRIFVHGGYAAHVASNGSLEQLSDSDIDIIIMSPVDCRGRVFG